MLDRYTVNTMLNIRLQKQHF